MTKTDALAQKLGQLFLNITNCTTIIILNIHFLNIGLHLAFKDRYPLLARFYTLISKQLLFVIQL
jgi:hypothetical protein